MLLTLGLFSSALAQNAVTFENVVVDIWPEYDRPTVLVMYHLTLASSVKLPAEVTIRVPESVGRPHAVATQDEAGLLNLSYTTTTQNGWLLIKFTTAVTDVRIEYYDLSLQVDGTKRSFTYSWPGDHTVNNLTMQIQQPANASNMTFVPELGSGYAKDGLTYYNMLVGQINAGTNFDLQISYTKPDNTLTNANSLEPAQPIQPVDSNTSGRVTFNDFLPWVLGSLGVLLIAIGGLWYWRTGQLNSGPARPRHNSRRSPTGAANMPPAAGNEKATVYCSQCGKRAGPSDIFCRTCGTKLRS
jgi:hypothetical protein